MRDELVCILRWVGYYQRGLGLCSITPTHPTPNCNKAPIRGLFGRRMPADHLLRGTSLTRVISKVAMAMKKADTINMTV